MESGCLKQPGRKFFNLFYLPNLLARELARNVTQLDIIKGFHGGELTVHSEREWE